MDIVHFLTHGPVAILARPTISHVTLPTPVKLISSRAGASAATSAEIPSLTANMLRSAPSRVMDKSYKAAVEILNARRRQARPTGGPSQGLAGLSRLPERDGPAGVKGTPSIVGMKEWLDQIGHSSADIDKLNVIHVAGTKGKGSTCAFAESLLRSYGQRTGFPRKTGLYSSPHLISHEERIRIDTRPIARDLFAKYFFEVWDSLLEKNEVGKMPRTLQLLALVSLHAFIREGVEAAVVETHHGGEYDATNVVEAPVAAVVTSLGMDHAAQLGPGIENIAWHKSGIFKAGARTFSAVQEGGAAEVIRRRAAEKGVELQFIADDEALPGDAPQLRPDVQRMNCALAVAAVRSFVEARTPGGLGPLLPADVRRGVEGFSWPGRFQVILDGAFRWFLEGAHNEMSIAKAAEWFAEVSQMQGSQPAMRILIFNQISDERDSAEVLERLASSLKDCPIQRVIFAGYDPHAEFGSGTVSRETPVVPESAQREFGDIWRRHQGGSHVSFEPDIPSALDSARKLGVDARGAHVLITGSLHLVGGALFYLRQGLSVPA